MKSQDHIAEVVESLVVKASKCVPCHQKHDRKENENKNPGSSTLSGTSCLRVNVSHAIIEAGNEKGD